MTTKQAFLAEYRRVLVRTGEPWCLEEARINKFMNSVATTVRGGNTWNHNSLSARKAWRNIGGKGSYSLKALRALPEAVEVTGE
jgi:hypothetical protein